MKKDAIFNVDGIKYLMVPNDSDNGDDACRKCCFCKFDKDNNINGCNLSYSLPCGCAIRKIHWKKIED